MPVDSKRSWGAALVLLSLALACGIWVWSGVSRHRDAAATTQADPHHEQALTQAAQGGVRDQIAKAAEPQLAQDKARSEANDAEVARLRGGLARLRTAPSRPDSPAPEERLDPSQPAPPPVDLAAVVAAQEAMIQAQDQRHADDVIRIQHLEAQNLNLTQAGEAWRAAYNESAKEVVLLKIAHEAQVSVIRAERWKGRVEGLAIGLAGGYMTGRLR